MQSICKTPSGLLNPFLNVKCCSQPQCRKPAIHPNYLPKFNCSSAPSTAGQSNHTVLSGARQLRPQHQLCRTQENNRPKEFWVYNLKAAYPYISGGVNRRSGRRIDNHVPRKTHSTQTHRQPCTACAHIHTQRRSDLLWISPFLLQRLLCPPGSCGDTDEEDKLITEGQWLVQYYMTRLKTAATHL